MLVTFPLHLCPPFCVVPFYCLHNVKTVLRVIRDLQARVSGDDELDVKGKLWMLLHISGLLVMFSINPLVERESDGLLGICGILIIFQRVLGKVGFIVWIHKCFLRTPCMRFLT